MPDSLFFVADDLVHGRELWIEDGLGARLVKDLLPDADSANPRGFVVFAGELYFLADDPVRGADLWRSDGTALGTQPVRNLDAGADWQSVGGLAVAGGDLYFTAYDPTPAAGASPYGLYRWDGSAVTLVGSDNAFAYGSDMVEFGGALYFPSSGPSGWTLAKADPATGAVTFPASAMDLVSGAAEFVALGGHLYFVASDPTEAGGDRGAELWRTDGVTAQRVTDINPTGSSFPEQLTAFGGKLYFVATETGYEQLWTYDPAAGPTGAASVVMSPSGAPLFQPENLLATASYLYVSTSDGTVWRIDGTNVTAVLAPPAVSSVGEFVEFDGDIYFGASNSSGIGLWRIDGAAGTAALVKDLDASSFPSNFAVRAGKLYFSLNDGVNGEELWVTDGTAAGTILAADIAAGASGSNPDLLTAADVDLTSANQPPANLVLDYAAGGDAVVENAVAGTVVGTVLVSDADGPVTGYSFALRDDAGGRFEIDPATGLLTVAGDLDHEGTPGGQYTIQVRVTDENGAQVFDDTLTVAVADVPEGTPDNDHLVGTETGERMDGGAGVDTLYGQGGGDSIEGGTENDQLYGGAGSDTLRGGDGDDSFYDAAGADSAIGGAGADQFYSVGQDGDVDRLTGDGDGAAEAAQDTYHIEYWFTGTADRVSDFDVGAVRDVIDLNAVLGRLTGHGYVSGENPFTTGYLRLQDDGAGNTLLQANLRDTIAGTDAWTDLLLLDGRSPSQFTQDNFSPIYHPHGNSAPVAADDSATVGEDSGWTEIDVRANDADAENDPLTVTDAQIVSGDGSVTWDGTGVHYTPNGQYEHLGQGQSAQVEIAYTVGDGQGESDTATLTVTVEGANDAPTAVGTLDAQSVDEGAGFAYTVPAGAFQDVDQGDTLTLSARLNGNAALPDWLSFDPATGAFSGTPGIDDAGFYQILVTATDAAGAAASHWLTITVNNVNDAPTAVDDTAGTSEDAAVTIDALANDADPDSDPLAITGVTASAGHAALDAQGRIVFDPSGQFESLAEGQQATVTIDYTVSDGQGGTDTAQVAVTVTGVNDAPYLAAGFGPAAATQDQPFAFQVPAGAFQDVDTGDQLAYTARLANGDPLPSWLGFDPATRTFSGTPGDADVGAISVKLVAADGRGGTAEDVFEINVANTVHAPTVAVAVDDATIDEGGSVTLTATVADIDTNDTYTAVIDWGDGSAPEAAAVVNGQIQATHAYRDDGAYTPTVTVTDDEGGVGSGSANVSVANVAPAAQDVTIGAAAGVSEDGGPRSFAFSGAAPAGTDDTVSFAIETQPGEGTVVNNNDGSFAFDPGSAFQDLGAGETRTVSFTYTARDEDGGASAPTTVSITVSGVNDAPEVDQGIADQAAKEGTAFAFTVPAAAFADVDGDALSLSAVLVDANGDAQPLPGWLSFANGAFTGTPPAGAAGTLTVRVTAGDGKGSTVSDDFAIVITTGVNEPPTAITLAGPHSVAENAPGAVVGAIAVTDADDDAFTFTVSDGRFEVAGNPTDGYALKLKAGESLDFEAEPTVSLTVTARDSGGAEISQTFTIGTQDVTTNDTLVFGDSDDNIAFPGAVNADGIDGGGGNDTLVVTADTVTITPNAAGDALYFELDEDGDGDIDRTLTARNVEDVEIHARVATVSGDFTGTGLSPDTITYVGDDGANSFDASGMTSAVSVDADGKGGNDVLKGGAGNDRLDGGADSDTLEGNGGDDLLVAGAGNDALSGGAGVDTYDASANTTGVFVDLAAGTGFGGSETGSDTLSGIENVRGGSGHDNLSGDGADNVFYASAGNDIIDGRGGADSFDASGAAHAVTVNLAGGTATGTGNGSDTLSNIENAAGGAGDDSLTGDAGANVLAGNGGADLLTGGAGDDRLEGGAGQDTAVFSGNYADYTIAFNADGTITVSGADGSDTVSGVEKLQFADRDAFIVDDDGVYSAIGSIQAGVDAAGAGDVVLVASGTYREQVTITKDLTLEGRGATTPLIEAPDALVANLYDSGSGTPNKNALIGVEGATVTIRGLALDGRGLGNAITGQDGQPRDFDGIYLRNSGGLIENVTVTGIRDAYADANDTLSGMQRGLAIAAVNRDGAARSVTVRNSTVEDFQKNGLTFDGAGLTVTVTGNTITGGGLQSIIAQNGIQVSRGATGLVEGNTVSAIGFGPDSYGASGILVYQSDDVTVSNNNVMLEGDPNDAAIAFVDADNPTATGNDIADAGYGIYQLGDFTGELTHSGNDYSGTDVAVGFYPGQGGQAYEFTGSQAGDELVGNDQGDTLAGADGDDSVSGEAGNDSLSGDAGHDDLSGGAGDDLLAGGAGDDALAGGDGGDAAVIAGAFDPAQISYDAGTWTIATEGTDTLTGVEKAVFTDGPGSGDDATVWLVANDAQLQAALAAAADGDTILLAAGTYTQAVDIGKAVTLLGLDRAGVVFTVSGDDAFDIDGDIGAGATVRFENLTIRDGSASGIRVASGATLGTLEIVDCTIDGNAFNGLGMGSGAPGLGAVVITNSSFSGNGTAGGNGSGDISLFHFHGDATLTDVSITGGAGAYAGLQIAGFVPAPSYDVSAPIGNVTLDGVTVTGAYNRPLVYIHGYNNLDGLNIAGLTLDGASAWTGLFINPSADATTGEAVGTNNGFPGAFVTDGTVAVDLSNVAVTGGSYGWGAPVTVKISPATDDYTGSDAGDVFETNAANFTGDSIDGGLGHDTLVVTGGGAFDMNAGDVSNVETVRLAAATDFTADDTAGLSISGSAGDDTITLGAGGQTVNAGDGADRVILGAGNDAVDGQGGAADVASVAADLDDATIAYDAGTGTWTVTTAAGGTDTLKGVEAIEFNGVKAWLVPTGGSIQAAVNAAQAGDVILVAPGTYNENVTIDKGVKLLSIAGREATTIQGTETAGKLGTLFVRNNTNGVQIGDDGHGFTIIGYDAANPGIEHAAVYFQAGHQNVLVRGNDIRADGELALLTEYNAAINGMVVDGNIFSGQTFVGTTLPVFGSFPSAQWTVHNVPRQLVVISGGAGVTNTQNVSFTNNVVSGTAGALDADGTPRGNYLVTIDVVNGTVQGNTFDGFTYAPGLRVRGPNTDVIDNVFDNRGAGFTTGAEIARNDATYSGNVFLGESGADLFTGTPGADTMDGGDGDDTLIGRGGADSMTGGAGADSFVVTAAEFTGDSIAGGDGGDTLRVEGGGAFDMSAGTVSGAESVVLAAATDFTADDTAGLSITGSAGADNITFGAGGQSADAGAGDDAIIADLDDVSGAYVVQGGNDADTLTVNGTAGGDSITVTAGTGGFTVAAGGVTIAASGVEDLVVNGGDGDDAITLSGDFADTGIAASTITVTGGDGGDVIDGTSLSGTRLVLNGGAGDDALTGGAADDELTGGAGNDALTGGGGADTAFFAGDIGDYTVTRTASGYQVVDGNAADGDEGADTLSGVETLEFATGGTIALGGPVELVRGGSIVNTFTSIQAAIDAAAANDTIVIRAGTYNENVTVNKDGLSLIGEGEVTIRGTFKSDNGIAENGSVAEFLETATAYTGAAGTGVSITANNVTLSNLNIASFRQGVGIDADIAGLALTDVEVSGVIAGVLKAMDASIDGLTITGGSMRDAHIGVDLSKDPALTGNDAVNVTIDGTQFSDITAKGIYAETLSNALLTGIVMNKVGYFGAGPTFGAYAGAGIELNLKKGDYSNVTITDFDLTDVGRSTRFGAPHDNAAAIAVKTRSDSPAYSPVSFTGAVVISNGTIDGTSTGIRAGEAGKTVNGPAVAVSGVSITGAVHDAQNGDVENLTTQPMTVTLTSGDDLLAAGPQSTGVLLINAGDGDDTIAGGSGADRLDGGAGSDAMAGGAGDDTYVVDDAGDTVDESGGSGIDTVEAGVSHTLSAGVENLALTGAGDIDGAGNALGNVISGNAGANDLDGGAGNDSLTGGLGDDALTGGDGEDVATFAGSRSDYAITKTSDGQYQIVGPDGADTLAGVEGVRFGSSGIVYELDANGPDYAGAKTRSAQGFEADASGWLDSDDGSNGQVVRVPSGAGGIDSFDGDAHALFTQTGPAGGESGPFTRFDGYRSFWPGEWRTQVRIYLDTGWDEGEGFDYSVAANGADGNHRRDFVFHVAKDASTGALLVGGSNNTNFAPRQDLDTINHAVIEQSGWYTFEHKFYERNGRLEVALNVYDADGDWVFTEVRSDPSDLIGLIGGNRYGWFTNIDVAGGIAVDGVELATIDGNPVQVKRGNTIVSSHATIQEGADAAQPGDIVLIDDGDYAAGGAVTVNVENLTFSAGAGATGIALVLGTGIAGVTLAGAADIDVTGNALANAITGNAGDNRIDGGAGADSVAGGAGDDTYVVDDAGDAVSEAAGQGTDAVEASVTHALSDHIENLTLTGSGDIDGAGNADGNAISGNGGDNLLSGLGGNDTLAGNGGDDRLDGGAGADAMAGSLGDDTYVVDEAGDTVDETGGDGTDTVEAGIDYALGDDVENLTLTGAGDIDGAGNALANAITGNTGDNALSGLGGNDVLTGGDGADTLEGGAGNDAIDGGAGDDAIAYAVGDGQDSVAGGDDDDTLTVTGSGADETYAVAATTGQFIVDVGGDAGPELTVSAVEDLVINAGDGDDMVTLTGDLAVAGIDAATVTVNGGGGADVLDGSAASGASLALNGEGGNDSLTGGAADDVLTGGAGDDTIAGGGGEDTALFAGSRSAYTVTNNGDGTYTVAGPDGADRVAADVETLSFGDGAETTLGWPVELVRGGSIIDSFATLREAIDAAASGDTVRLLAGEHAGDVLVNKAGITIEGANAGIPSGGSRGAESVFTGRLVIVADGVTVDGLKLVDGASGGAYDSAGIHLQAAGATIVNSVFVGSGAAGFRGIVTAAGAGDGSVIADNSFTGWATGVYVNPGATGIAVHDNVMDGNHVGLSIDGADNASITGNAFLNNSFEGLGIGPSADADSTITGNRFEGNAVDIGNYDPNLDTDVVAGNTIRGTAGDDVLSDDGTGGGREPGHIGGNVFEGLGGDDALLAGSGDDAYDGGAGTDSFDAAADVAGITVDLAAGTASGAAIGSDALANIENVIGGAGDDALAGDAGANVLTGNAGNDTLTGAGGDDTVVYAGSRADYTVTNLGGGLYRVVDNNAANGDEGTDTVSAETLQFADATTTLNGAVELVRGGSIIDSFATLQEAIDAAASGDTVRLLAGEHAGDVLVNKAGITIEGANAGIPSGGSRGAESVFTGRLVIVADGVTVDGLKLVDGAAGGAYDSAAIHLQAANATIVNNLFARGGAVDGDGFRGIVTAAGAGDGAVIADNSFTGWATGVYVNPGAAGITVSGNVMDGNYVGLSIDGADQATITGNQFLNNGFEGLGIGPGADAASDIAGNLFQGNGADIGNYDPSLDGGVVAGNTVRGSAGDDLLSDDYLATGRIGGNVFEGLGGDDTLVGGAGDDTILGGDAGADAGVDTVDYAADAAGVTVDLAAGTAAGAAIGSDTLSGIENVAGGAGGDALTGDAGANVLTGNAGNDTLEGGAGDDDLAGGAGDDAFAYGVGDGQDAIDGGADADSLAIDGTAGDDAVALSTAAGGFTVDTNGVGPAEVTASAIETLSLDAGDGTDTVTLSGDLAAAGLASVTIDGGAGHDMLDAGAASGLGVTLSGGLGDDTLAGGAGDDELVGGAGLDTAVLAGGFDIDTFGFAGGLWTHSSAGGGGDTLDGIEKVAVGGRTVWLVASDATMQTALANATAGDAILVAPGSYGPIALNVAVELLALDGAAGATTITGAGVNQGAAVRVNAGADGARIGADGHGFTLAAAAGDLAGLYVAAGVAGLTVEGNGIVAAGQHALLTEGGVSGLRFEGNAFEGTGGALVYVNGAASVGVASTAVDFIGNTFAGDATGPLLGLESDNGAVYGNVFSGSSGWAGLELFGTGNDLTGPSGEVNDFAGFSGPTDVRSAVSFDMSETPSADSLVLTGAGDIDADGNALDNVITGNDGDNAIAGHGGDDTLAGGAGDDDLAGGAGDDRLEGGRGDDLIDGEGGADTVVYAGDQSDYEVTNLGGGQYQVRDLDAGDGDEGTDIVTAETLEFADGDTSLNGRVELIRDGSIIDSFDSIQDAIDAAADGDTIKAAAGAYAEDLVIDKDITLVGANAGVNPNAAARGAESALTGSIRIVADGVTVDGLQLLQGGTVLGSPAGIYVQGEDAAIADMVFARSGGFDGFRGILTEAGGGAGLQVSDSSFTGWATGVYLNPGATGASVSGSVFDGNNVGLSMDGAADVSVTGNRFLNNAFEGLGVGPGSDGSNTVSGNLFQGNGNHIGNYEPALPADVVAGNTIRGTAGGDRLTDDYLATGRIGGNVFEGLGGDDTLVGGTGDDSYDGGAGTDTLDLSAETAGVAVDLTAGTATGAGIGSDTLADIEEVLGGSGDDTLIGGAGADRLVGNDGNDRLSGRGGADTMEGGVGDDIYVVDDAGDVVTEGDGEGIDLVGASISHALAANVENLTLTGSGNISGIGNGLDNAITGNGGNNALAGGLGDDTLDGGDGDDLVEGEGGDDLLWGGLGSDTLRGGAGSDTLAGEAGGDLLEGGAGDDTIAAGGGSDTVSGDAGNDLLIAGADLGNDAFDGGADTDTISYAGTNNGIIVDLVNGSAFGTLIGVDTIVDVENVVGGSGADVLTGNGAANELSGGDGNDALNGGAGADTLRGEGGNDALNGGADADLLDGGAGADAMTGGAGNDVYVVDDRLDRVQEAAGEGTDEVRSEISSGVAANTEILTLIGTGDIDAYGTGAANRLNGNDGDNLLVGRSGSDTLSGGAGDDRLQGDGGLDMDGGTSAVLVSGVADFPTTAFTVEVEFSTTDTTKTHALFSYARGGVPLDNEVLLFNQQNLQVWIGNQAISTGLNFADGLDHRLTVTWESASGALRVYDNGVERFAGTFRAGYVLTGGGTVVLGQEQDALGGGFSPSQAFKGQLYGMRLWDRAVSADEAASAALPAPSEPGLVADFRFAEGTGSSTADETGAHVGQIVGGATWIAAADSLSGGAGNDTYVVTSAGDTIIEAAGGGIDTVEAWIDHTLAANVENLVLVGAGGLTGTGNAGANSITGGAGNDTLNGGDGTDTLIGGAGDDLLRGGSHIDSFDGGAGEDTVTFDFAPTTAPVDADLQRGDMRFPGGTAPLETIVNVENLIGGAGHDRLSGDGNANRLSGLGGNDRLVGRGGDDRLDGGDGTDTLDGGDGDDWLSGGIGADAFDGGAGVDTLSYEFAPSTAPVDVDLQRGPYVNGYTGDMRFPGGAAPVEYIRNVENVIGGDGGDRLAGDANANRLEGGAGNDIIGGRDGNDWIDGGAGDDVVNGGAGDDWLSGGTGTDSFDGGAGVDTLSYAFAGVGVHLDVDLGRGDMRFVGGAAPVESIVNVEAVIGGAGNDRLTGNAGVNTLEGGAGNDWIDGGAGVDVLRGGAGDDWLSGGAGVDSFDGGDGVDTVSYEFAGPTVHIDVDLTRGDMRFHPSVTPEAIVDVENVIGGAGNDRIAGSAGTNALTGGAGNDTLIGLGGNDVLTGGAGNDVFVLGDSVGDDRIEGFAAGAGSEDVIDLSGNSALNDFAGVLAAATQAGSDTLIDLGNGDTLTLVGVNRADLHEDDFRF